MDGSLDTLDAYELLSENSIAALMAHPNFRAACETSAAGGVAHFLSLSETHRWLMKDIGRAAICLTAAILQITEIGLTAQSLTTTCLAHEISSAGRVLVSTSTVSLFSTGSDSPVRLDWLTNRSRAVNSRTSAGIMSPAATMTTSPGTTSRNGISRGSPSRRTSTVT